MNDQPGSKATQSNVLKKENLSVEKLAYIEDVTPLGFLQLCADRRFHPELQARFQRDAKLQSPTHFWIHADAGGTPKMECQRTAPDYCYYQKDVRLMGWAAHGDICGGFGTNVPDDEILEALLVVARRKVEDYPDADHWIYFMTAKKEKDTEETIVYSMKCGKRSA